jgi:ABC-type multidrug transport system ATPase subunit
MQDDCLMETLTVRECLQFGADLKMRAPQEIKNKRVDDIVRIMHLDSA